MSEDFEVIATGKLTPYTATFIFALGIFFSNFIFNTVFMYKPLSGAPVSYQIISKGNTKLHLIGIWRCNLVHWYGINTIAAGKAATLFHMV